MVSDKILVASILYETAKNDVEVRKLYLPKGVRFNPYDNVVNITTNIIYNAPADLSQIPYFKKV